MKRELSKKVHLPTIVFSLFVMSLAGAIQMGCSDQMLGLDESALATQQANENIKEQVAGFSHESENPADGPVISNRPADAGDTFGDLNPPIVPGGKDSARGGADADTVRQYRPGLESEMNLVLTFQGADTANIGTSGGQIVLTGLAGKGRLTFPSDALKKTEEITALTCNSMTEDLLVYEFKFGPDGTKFDQSISLQLSATLFTSIYGKLPKSGVWMYWDEIKHEWIALKQIYVSSDGNFNIPIEHFSSYRMVVTPAIGLSQGGQN